MKKMKLNIKLFSINLDNENDSEIDEYITFKNKPDTTTPINAENLNYVQRMIKRDIETVETNVTDIETSINDIETSINDIKGTILWENPNPTTDFAAQDITLSSSDYDCYEVIYKQNTNTNRALNTGKIVKGYGAVLNEALSSSRYRAINYNSETSLNIGEGTSVTPYGNTVPDNYQCIPLYIIGYKTGLFGGQS